MSESDAMQPSENIKHKHHVRYTPEIIKLIDGALHIKKHHEQARNLAKEMGFSFREAQKRLKLERNGSNVTIRRIFDF